MDQVKPIKDVEALRAEIKAQIDWHNDRARLIDVLRLYLNGRGNVRPTVRDQERIQAALDIQYTGAVVRPLVTYYSPVKSWDGSYHWQLRFRHAMRDGSEFDIQINLRSDWSMDDYATFVGHSLYRQYAEALKRKLPDLDAAVARYNAAVTELQSASDFARDSEFAEVRHSPIAPLSDAFCWYQVDRKA